MQRKHTTHRAYLVRGWREGESTTDGKPLWRFSVEEVLHTRRRFGFGSLEGLLAFLREELSGSAEDDQVSGCKVAGLQPETSNSETLQPQTSNLEPET